MRTTLRRHLTAVLRGAVVHALALTFGALGRLALLRHGQTRPPASDQVRRILVIRLDLLGDVVMSLPAVRALREHYPQARITMLALPLARGLLEGCPDIDEILTLDTNALRRPNTLLPALLAFLAMVRLLRERRFDVVVSLSGRTASALAILSGAPCRVGYRGEGYPYAFTLPVEGYRFHRLAHEVEYDLALVRALGCPAGSRQPRLLVPEDARRYAATLVPQGGRPLIVLHPGATNGSAKRWPVDRWARLAVMLVQNGCRVALIGSSGDRGLTGQIIALARSALPRSQQDSCAESEPATGVLIDLAGHTPHLLQLAALLERATVLVSGDSGPAHIAVAVGCKLVEIFGPTDPRTYGPLDPEAIVLRAALPCSPCYDNTRPAECPFGNPICMQLIGVELVYQAVQEVLTRLPAAARQP
jgi:lipopolysaccharide heptosyltransferase II